MANKKDKNKTEESEENLSDLTPGGGETEDGDEGVVIAKAKLALIKKLLRNIKENNDRIIQLLTAFVSPEEETRIGVGQAGDESFGSALPALEKITEGKIIEGVFDGENMIGPDGKQYNVPANYASKSKLVEGDILKLTITANGTFVFKQIGPIERIRLVGRLEKEKEGEYVVAADGKNWRVLNASITYFKGEVGDEVAILLPKTGESRWAAVENIIKKK